MPSKSAIAEYLATSQYPTAIFGGGSLFTFRSTQDFKDSTQEIAETDQGGLGLPDRDYYTKDDAKSEELRKAYVAHVQKIFELLGDKPEQASAEAATVLRIETELAKGQMTRVDRRDPKKLYHKMTVAELNKLSPLFSWKVYLDKSGLASVSSLNVVTPDYVRVMNATLDKESLPDWKTYLRWHAAHSAATNLSSAFVEEDLQLLRQDPSRPGAAAASLETLLQRCGPRSRRSAGTSFVARYFSPEAKQAL